MSYCTIDQAKSAGASGTDTDIQAAIDQAKVTIDQYCRETFEPTNAVLTVYVGDVYGRLPRWAASVTEGTLDVDGFTWYPPTTYPWSYSSVVGGEWLVSADIGSRTVPLAVSRAAARWRPSTAPLRSVARPTLRVIRSADPPPQLSKMKRTRVRRRGKPVGANGLPVTWLRIVG